MPGRASDTLCSGGPCTWEERGLVDASGRWIPVVLRNGRTFGGGVRGVGTVSGRFPIYTGDAALMLWAMGAPRFQYSQQQGFDGAILTFILRQRRPNGDFDLGEAGSPDLSSLSN